MFYRENGQFKSSYEADSALFPIAQDRYAMMILAVISLIAVPLFASDYLFQAVLIPFLILSLAAMGLNVLVGYCGLISLGTGAFMAVGAYAAYNLQVRFDGMPLVAAILGGGACATVVGVAFGIPSLRIRGLYLAVATLAAQFFIDWFTNRVAWVTNGSLSGSVSVPALQIAGYEWNAPVQKYLLCLFFVAVFGLLTKNLVRGAIGREWMAIRDMDVAAAVFGIRRV
jgi:branched-chain amino acid transport system permease protein